MKYEKVSEQYNLIKNDGTGPFEKDVKKVIINYNCGKPVYAVLSRENNKHSVTYSGTRMGVETNPPKLTKIVNFFNKK